MKIDFKVSNSNEKIVKASRHLPNYYVIKILRTYFIILFIEETIAS